MKLSRLSGVHAPVDVRDQFQRDAVDARIARRGAVRQPRQLPAVRRRQVPPGRPDLLLDQIKIVQQPLRRRRIAALALGRLRHQLIRLDENALILVQPGNELVRSAPPAS